MKKPRYWVYVSLLSALSCIDNEPPVAQPVYQISEYRNATAARRFDQCAFRYAFRNESKSISLGTLQKQLEVPFDRWADATGYLTFERVTATATAEINILFTDSLRSAAAGVTSFGLVGQPIGVLSQLVRASDNTCTIYLLDTHQWDIVSLQRVLLFQIGAALGLATSTNQASVMSGLLLNARTVLDTSDVNAIKRVYNQPCDKWTRLDDLPFNNFYFETAAATSTRGYVLLNTISGNNAVWEFTPETNKWQARVPFPATGASNSPKRVAFAIGNNLYGGNGHNISWLEKTAGAFYRYVPGTNQTSDQWVRVDSLGQIGYSPAQSFALNGKGYIVTFRKVSEFASQSMVWAYDPSINKWAELPASARPAIDAFDFDETFPFVLENAAYLISPGAFSAKSWRFEPTQNPPWTTIVPFVGNSYTQISFGVRGAGYNTSGSFDAPKQVWQYKPEQGWKQMSDFGAQGRFVFSFSVGNRAYVGTDTGQFWMYRP